jgi:PAS domain S-box-containing protein
VVIDNARTHRALRSASERLTTIIAESPIATAVLDSDWNVQSWNRASELLFGWTGAEIVGRPLPTKPSDILDAEHDLQARVKAGESVRNLESRSRHRDGRDIAVSLYAAPLRADGHIIGAVLRWIDLTERQQLEGQLHQAQRLESVGRLAGGIAHDFNNILTAILGFAGLILEDLPDGDPRRANAQAIEEAAQRATDLVRQLLAFGRQQVFRLEVVDIGEVVTRLSPMLQRLIGEDVTVTVVSPESSWPVEADRSQLEQVIVNLAVNARDAMPRGGRLTIEIANVDLNEQYAETHAEVSPGPHVMLAVSDTGTGMDAETTSRIFEPFFTTKEAGRGTGLGLSTVYGIVRQSGGHIWVYSELGRGSTFRLYFPRATTQAASTQPPRAAQQAVTGTETILVAEDEEILRALIDVILRRLGYTVLLAPNGEAALQIARERPIDLLLTDVVMPGQSGFELAAAIREVSPNTPVLMMSGYTSAALEPHGLVEGEDLLQKPFTPDTLGQAVRARLSRGA